MSRQEKLQKAIEAAIIAGYQLNSEAFEFLTQNVDTMDPEAVMNLALMQLSALEDKPIFIDRDRLVSVIHQLAVAEMQQALENQTETQPTNEPNPVNIFPEAQSYTEPTINAVDASDYFYPYAKDISSELIIIEDPTGKLTSNGTIQEYTALFQDRFRRVEKILRNRMDVRSATPLAEAVKSQPKSKLKVICMLTEKRDSKNNTILSVEDPNSSATIVIPHKAPEEVKKKALTLLPDTVFCAAVIKTRTNLLMAEDIILPEVGRKAPKRPKNLSMQC
jgi:DNA polymerase II small subunit/DNA polymerase delta subunit B